MDLRTPDTIHFMHGNTCIIHELFAAPLTSQHRSQYPSLLCGLRDESSHLHESALSDTPKHWAKLLVIKFAPLNITFRMQITVFIQKKKQSNTNGRLITI